MKHHKMRFLQHGEHPCETTPLSELCLFVELMALRLSPAYYGYGIPRGDGSAVIVIPGLMGWDGMLVEIHAWLRRIGYRPYFSGMGMVADCPNTLAMRLNAAIDRAFLETGKKVHLVGHSFGGIFARTMAASRPEHIASVITLGSPFRGLVANRLVFDVAKSARYWISSGSPGLPEGCGTSRCSCPFVRSLRRSWPRQVSETAIFTKSDGLVDWRYCRTGDEESDVEVHGTHIGMVFNAETYEAIGNRLGLAQQN